MKKFLVLVLAAILLPSCLIGCGASEKDKGINSNKDMPKADKAG